MAIAKAIKKAIKKVAKEEVDMKAHQQKGFNKTKGHAK